MAYSFKGAISFGLIYIPVTLTAAIRENDIGFNMLDKKTKSRIRYKKTCVDCGDREVKQQDIVKGYEYEEGKYVILTEEDFEKVKSKKDKNIAIERFVELKEINPLYFDRAFYVAPAGAEKAFCLLLRAWKKRARRGWRGRCSATNNRSSRSARRTGKCSSIRCIFTTRCRKTPQRRRRRR